LIAAAYFRSVSTTPGAQRGRVFRFARSDVFGQLGGFLWTNAAEMSQIDGGERKVRCSLRTSASPNHSSKLFMEDRSAPATG